MQSIATRFTRCCYRRGGRGADEWGGRLRRPGVRWGKMPMVNQHCFPNPTPGRRKRPPPRASPPPPLQFRTTLLCRDVFDYSGHVVAVVGDLGLVVARHEGRRDQEVGGGAVAGDRDVPDDGDA